MIAASRHFRSIRYCCWRGCRLDFPLQIWQLTRPSKIHHAVIKFDWCTKWILVPYFHILLHFSSCNFFFYGDGGSKTVDFSWLSALKYLSTLRFSFSINFYHIITKPHKNDIYTLENFFLRLIWTIFYEFFPIRFGWFKLNGFMFRRHGSSWKYFSTLRSNFSIN